ncbi:SDR family oxidoreductase [Trichlorobacter lovleyi]|uniref:dTDP-4-dehydrorhamnose reductase family protein n=1 Tax=Trichlorobacter lovleyi TaxID=313985 RepID=UPI0022405665|nr:SDR family oxidoreductase [Trichlorobacter lovleyi]QOX80363.1 SDR family oxidoreductase [Trichlorobacter lovleyi]
MTVRKLNILLLGASGMLGHTLFSRLCQTRRFNVRATARKKDVLTGYFDAELLANICGGIDTDNFDSIVKIIGEFNPDVVINCVGIIKQLAASAEHIPALSVNSLFPHRLNMLCKAAGARLIHISSDCVFDGQKGSYLESDLSNASDLYGRTKFLGEVADSPHSVTLRTSIIGHELGTRYGLVEWFLAQRGDVKGFTKAVFSGFPTVELANIIIERVIPNASLSGLYHVSSAAISKYDLLKIIASRYGVSAVIEPYADFFADRSLDSTRFRQATGYCPPSWERLVDAMYDDFVLSHHYAERKRN